MVKSGGLWGQTTWLSLLEVITIFAVVEELGPVNLEVWLAVFSAHSALSGEWKDTDF